VRDLAEELKKLDQDSEVSVVIPDLPNAEPFAVFIVDEHVKDVEIELSEIELSVEAAKPVNLMQSQFDVSNTNKGEQLLQPRSHDERIKARSDAACKSIRNGWQRCHLGLLRGALRCNSVHFSQKRGFIH
jgi:hypothetical protein